MSQQKRYPTALLIIDMINELKFSKAPLLLEEMKKKIITPLAELRQRAKAAGIPIIYVNDNYGIWQSELNQIVNKAVKGAGRELVEKIRPESDDFFVVKPKHSGFFSTPLSTLLSQLGTNTLILTGAAGNVCVLFTANDAYMRDYRLFIPQDCCASNVKEDNDYAR
ncbi:isochorismatase family cysteine hydrolase [Terrilactibacillus sp. S3-3]|nr:isochorismatase family cysteine hydrolase [Terrilactibacillus sp. S3-3]